MAKKTKEMLRELIAKQQGITGMAEAEQRDLTVEEQAEFDGLQRSIDLLNQLEDDSEPADSHPQGDGRSADPAAMERHRAAEIVSLCRDFDIDPAEYIKDADATPDTVRAAIIEKQRREHAPVRARVTADEDDKYRAAAADAMVMRAGLAVEKPAEGAAALRGMSLRDLAVECLSRSGDGGAVRLSRDDLFAEMQRQFFNPTAAFPSILDQTVRKSYETGYNEVQVTFDQWTSRGTLTDFKRTQSGYLAGPAGEFKLVPENGELEHDLPVDGRTPTRQLQTFGRQFTMTRQAFINDDIGFLTTVPARYARSARTTINKQVYEVLFKNPVIHDGVALFDATKHNNLLATGTEITAESMQSMMLRMQMQKDDFGNAIIIRPEALVVPVGYGFKTKVLFESPTIHTEGNTQSVNPLYQPGLRIIEDPTLNAMGGTGALPWFLVANRSDAKSLQVDYLDGQEIPTIRRSERPGTLGFVWDIYLDWGITALDYRGIVKNPGKPLSI
ncbi:phage major capsid protein [Intestinibacillus massiliensis]|uniref:phage major capsid protein n=1 Tax=Intestinibacillus massiliensis TaxID=1871029 RepID=UPI001F1BAC35|nr:hypothetical protein [Intestinibacillus massiliensis]